jgi:hypothetical protein
MERLPDSIGTLPWAQTYADWQWPIIPLYGKVPAIKYWQRFVPTPVNVRFWFGTKNCNIGLRTGESGYVVVDTDTQDAEQWVIHHLPETPMQALSGNGSRHRYYRSPSEPEIRNKQHWMGILGLDVRGHGGFIVLPGSLHPKSGKRYEWQGDTSDPSELPLFAPSWVLDRKKDVRLAVASVLDRQAVLDRARKYLSKIEPAVSGSGGHTKTFTTALKLARVVNYDPDLLWVLLNEYNARCLPPWSEPELRHKWEEALKSRTVR